jgi:prepilin-type N-terminal cleavage/methylation domain-containing protein
LKKKHKQYALTLIEIMIVIVLIGLIGSVIGANMKGSLDEGRAFKTKYAMEQIKDILMLEVAKGQSIEVVVAEKENYLANSGMVKDAKKMLKDGWGEDFNVGLKGQKITISSKALAAYEAKKKKKLGTSASPNLAENNDDSDDE